ncbi:SDR family NAD(P)-dependent oxidoreductase [bacterium]|nr:MAG: SDR family NAD(P)-dependent oxidoreductase [bacterium]
MNIQTSNEKLQTSAQPQVWLITGASRGLGASIAKAALSAGHKVVATGRNPQAVESALGGASENLLTLQLDVTNETQAQSVVAATVERFGRIDVLVNNAGYGLFGALEECSAQEVETQFQTNVFGLLSVTRAVLPTMRKQRSGHIINLSSIGGFLGFDHAAIYCATKFAVEGISESLALEVKPFGIHISIIEPGYFRTDFLADNSVVMAANKLDAYDQQGRDQYANHNGKQAGDPDKLAQALLTIAASPNPPLRLPLGTDAVGVVEGKLKSVSAELEQWRNLSISTNITE